VRKKGTRDSFEEGGGGRIKNKNKKRGGNRGGKTERILKFNPKNQQINAKGICKKD